MKLGTCLGLSCAYFISVTGQALEDKLGLSDTLPTFHPGLSPQLWLSTLISPLLPHISMDLVCSRHF